MKNINKIISSIYYSNVFRVAIVSIALTYLVTTCSDKRNAKRTQTRIEMYYQVTTKN